MNTKEVIEQVTQRHRVDAELGLEVFEAVDREFPNGKGWNMANWYIIYDTLQQVDQELDKEDKVLFAEACYDIYLKSDCLEVRSIALAVVRLLNNGKPADEISSSDVKGMAYDMMQ